MSAFVPERGGDADDDRLDPVLRELFHGLVDPPLDSAVRSGIVLSVEYVDDGEAGADSV